MNVYSLAPNLAKYHGLCLFLVCLRMWLKTEENSLGNGKDINASQFVFENLNLTMVVCQPILGGRTFLQ